MTAPLAYTLRTAVFTVLYVAAAWAGRLTILDETNLSMVWPAAGVAVLWLASSPGRWPVMDMAAIGVAGGLVNYATGAPVQLALMYAGVNIVQAVLFVRVFERMCPDARRTSLEHLADLRCFLIAAVTAAALSAALGTAGTWLLADPLPWPAVAVWLARNAAGIILVGSAGLCLIRRCRTIMVDRRGLSERAAIAVVSVAAYWIVFGSDHLPISFSLLAMTVWVAMRCGVMFVTLHSLGVGALAVLFTLNGSGPFIGIESNAARALVVQAFVIMVSVVGMIVTLSRAEREELTVRATEARREAVAQARTLGAILDSMREGVGVVDSQGRFVLRNSATAGILGLTNQTGVIRTPDFYGLFHPDGTRVGPEEMPHLLAMQGHEVDNMDLVVRNPAIPDGRVINVNSTLMPPDDETGEQQAVIVFRDVTAERRHRDELAAFAGVVAHDLLNPLTTIDGWAEMLEDAMEDQPAGTEVGDGLVRIRRAAARMRHLINDLLAYTTSRDATLAPADVRLGDIVGDIVAARLDQAASAGGPRPRFEVGALPAVHADPVLLRQLLDNIIGNAVKYSRPGVPLHLTVECSTTDDGLIRVDVTDNGIGIPPGQHEAVFGNFHRAHRGAGRGGTGLGLAICKRIVERHGGTITARDNPAGQGTRISFTLPPATSVFDLRSEAMTSH
ncbi:ATP-binding protein [Spirillospora albida]|uniref:ATP-binding protein n=1 Tax=Spirillospora albida TaxID=58123 RepID=UPI0004C1E631|nr:ATP-binding protein [Spirillospora albida]